MSYVEGIPICRSLEPLYNSSHQSFAQDLLYSFKNCNFVLDLSIAYNNPIFGQPVYSRPRREKIFLRGQRRLHRFVKSGLSGHRKACRRFLSHEDRPSTQDSRRIVNARLEPVCMSYRKHWRSGFDCADQAFAISHLARILFQHHYHKYQVVQKTLFHVFAE